MDETVERKFQEWTQGKNSLQARISIYEKIRDIPYAVIPELVDATRYAEILRYNRGSCTPKHFLLGSMFQRLGIMVLYIVYPFRWEEGAIHYPPRLKRMAESMPTSYHLTCLVDIDGGLTVVDATLDPGLKILGVPVNEEWDGTSNTRLPIEPCGEEEIYHPSEAYLTPPRHYDQKSLNFYREFNRWLDGIRQYHGQSNPRSENGL